MYVYGLHYFCVVAQYVILYLHDIRTVDSCTSPLIPTIG